MTTNAAHAFGFAISMLCAFAYFGCSSAAPAAGRSVMAGAGGGAVTPTATAGTHATAGAGPAMLPPAAVHQGGAGASAQASRAAGSGGSGAGAGGAAANSGNPGAIWQPKPGVTWQWQLSGTLDTSVDAQMYDIDLFTNTDVAIRALQKAGRKVVCYFSAGSFEPDRPDSDALSKTGLGSTLDGWPDEKWLDIRSSGVRDVMKARLDTAKSKGCDGVEPDNVDGFDNDNGLGLTRDDQLDYNKFLAAEAHARGLSVGLKNSLALVSTLVGSFDWALNEECLQYDECSDLQPFISAGKAVFHCEYAKTTNGICEKKPAGFSTIVKNLDLDAFRLACP